jgi:hypothetical protein
MMDFYKKIIELYCSGVSGPKIAKKFRISKDVVYRVLKINNVQCRNRMQQLHIQLLSFNYKDYLTESEVILETAALMLYFGEGAKTGTRVDLANSDPKMMKIFMMFLRNVCQIDQSKLRFYLYCFADQDVEKIIRFWTDQLGIDRSSFTKPYIQNKTGNNNRIIPWGVLHIRYSDKRLLEKILFSCSSLADKIIEN